MKKTPPGSISGPASFRPKVFQKCSKTPPRHPPEHPQSDPNFLFSSVFLLVEVGSGPARARPRPGLDLAGPGPDRAWTWPRPGSGPARAPACSKLDFCGRQEWLTFQSNDLNLNLASDIADDFPSAAGQASSARRNNHASWLNRGCRTLAPVQSTVL